MIVAPTRHAHDRIHRPTSVSALGNRGLAEEPRLTDAREPVSTAGAGLFCISRELTGLWSVRRRAVASVAEQLAAKHRQTAILAGMGRAFHITN
jgi:hypothetical protein